MPYDPKAVALAKQLKRQGFGKDSPTAKRGALFKRAPEPFAVISAKLGEAGYLNERGRPYSEHDIKRMIGGVEHTLADAIRALNTEGWLQRT
jgi:hypothetical protein